VSELPPGWAEAGVLDVADSLDSQRVPVNRKEREQRPGSVPYYGATGQVGWIDEALFDEELCLLGEDGAPFLDRSKPKAYVIDGPSWVNNHAHVLRAIAEATSNKFLKYALDQFDYSSIVYGTTRLKLTKSAMRRMTIPVPPPAEQSRIVAAIEEHFSRLDAADQSLAQAGRRLATLRTATLAAATVGHESIELGSLVTDLRYGTSIKCSHEAEGPPVLRIPNVQGGNVDLSDLKFATDPDIDLSPFVLKRGDLLFVRTNGSRDLIGRVTSVDGAEGMAFASYLIRARPDRSRLEPRFAVIALSTPASRALIEAKAATTAGQYNLNLGALRSLPVPLPPIEEQRSIVAAIDQQLSIIDAMEAQVDLAARRSAALHRAILEQAFTGKLVPQNPSDEPASALLERISAERADTPKPSSRKRKISV
jgi:type I restriction enzyme, S subunit